MLALSVNCAELFSSMPTDITGVTASVSGYVTAAIVVGVAVMLFTLGRRVVKRLI